MAKNTRDLEDNITFEGKTIQPGDGLGYSDPEVSKGFPNMEVNTNEVSGVLHKEYLSLFKEKAEVYLVENSEKSCESCNENSELRIDFSKKEGGGEVDKFGKFKFQDSYSSEPTIYRSIFPYNFCRECLLNYMDEGELNKIETELRVMKS